MEHSHKIDRESSAPAYSQLVQIIRQLIADGVYPPGDRLPPESHLCKQFNVSPMTVRRSINILSDQKVVNTVRGSGTFVRPLGLEGITFSLEDFQNILTDKERTRVKILEVGIMEADKERALKLAIQKGDRNIFIRRVLIQDGDPIVYHKEYLFYDPKRPIVEAELEVSNLRGLFVGSGETFLKSGELSIEVAVLNKEEADILNTMEMLPAFKITHLFYDSEDRPVSWGQFICRGDLLKFTTTVGISKA